MIARAGHSEAQYKHPRAHPRAFQSTMLKGIVFSFLSAKAVCTAGMPLMKGRSLDTVKESEAAGSDSGDTDDTFSLGRAASGSLAEFPDWTADNPAQDCVDTSANVWETLAPLTSSANSQSIGHGLDFIAP